MLRKNEYGNVPSGSLWHNKGAGERGIWVGAKGDLRAVPNVKFKGVSIAPLAGEIADFTGVRSPYEAPPNPEIVVETDQETQSRLSISFKGG